jgi:hypothetical protein
MSTHLQFELYHSQLSRQDTLDSHLIGVAYVDLSQMVFVDDIN